MWRHYVYVHRRADDASVFYVGKGSHPDRVNERAGRNKHWQRIVVKHGLLSEVVAHFETDSLAQQHEKELIAIYGRKNLCNMTDGGDGCAGINPSPEARRKLSEAARRPRSAAWIASIRAARKSGGNGGVVKAGDKLPDWWKARIAATKIGDKNPMYGKTGAQHPQSRAVVDAVTGVTYPSVSAAADAIGAKMKSLYNMLSGHRPNSTSLRFA